MANKTNCPFCKSDKVRDIVYGNVEFKNEEEEKEFKKIHVLGGCNIEDFNPIFYCDNCNKEFGTIKERKEANLNNHD